MAGISPFPPSSHITSPPQHPNDFPTNTPPDSRYTMADFQNRGYVAMPHSLSQQPEYIQSDGRRPLPNGKPDKSPVAVPGPSGNRMGHNPNRSIGAIHPMDTSRSPPSSKNTSHVPCKFYRQGTCQAGKACPFSHTIDPSTELTPCKYFAKGNCKFGHKCALAHILPDGRRVNRHTLPAMTGSHLNLGGRIIPDAFQHQQSALANSLMQANTNNTRAYGPQYPYVNADEYQAARVHHGSRDLDYIPKIDTNFSSNPNSAYGSPREDGHNPLSPTHLTALDAPMPASFDSNGISWNARYGPAAASVPSKFGLESPPHSYTRQTGLPTKTLKSLHDSAFGGIGPDNSKLNNHPFASSPGAGAFADEQSPAPVPLHSRRLLKPAVMSSSMPRQMPRNLSSSAAAWDNETDTTHFTFEEDLVPNSLHELLTDQEKQRRFSRNEADTEPPRRALLNGLSSSPSSVMTGSSPSRFGALFTRQRPSNTRDDDVSTQGLGSSAFGHVGSPLRHSSLMSQHNSRNSISRKQPELSAADPSPSAAVGMITQQLKNTHVNAGPSAEIPGAAPLTNNPGGYSSANVPRQDRLPIGSNNVTGTAAKASGTGVDEEKEEFVFSMEVDDMKRNTSGASGPWNSG